MTTMPSYGGSRPFPLTVRRATDALATERWEDLGASAVIAATTQPPISRSIVQAQPFGDRIFLAYGEWNVGLDSCALLAWNTTTASYETLLADVATDALWVMRVVDGQLWALVTDPAVGTDPDAVVFDGAQVRTIGSGEITPWHLFDVAAWHGALYLAGANRVGEESHGTVWRSADRGATWTVALDLTDNQRIHGLFALEDELYAVGLSGQVWRTGDGTSWRRLDVDLLPHEMECVRPIVVAGQAVYVSGWTAFSAQNLYAFDGQQTSTLAPKWTVYDVFNDGDAAVILTTDREVKRSPNLTTWETIATGAPQEARSVCLLDQVIYVGTGDSRLWRWIS